MKRNLLRMMIPVVRGFLLPTIGLGQVLIDRMDQHADRVVYREVFQMGDDAWLVAGHGNPEGGLPSDLHFVTKCTDNGTQLWRYGHRLVHGASWNWDNPSPARAKQFSVLHDGGVLVVGLHDACDVFSGQSKVIRLNSDGNQIWEVLFSSFDFEFSSVFDRLANGPGLHHAIASTDSIITLSDEGNILHRWLSPASPVHCMRWENDTTLLVGAGNSVFRTHMDGTVQTSAESGADYIIDIRRDGDRVLVLTSTQIAVLSDGLEFSHWVLNPDEVYGFVDADDEVWLSAGGVLHRIEENGLTQLLETGTEAMAYRDGVVMTASWAGHHDRSGGRMKSYQMDGATVSHEDDVEIIGSVDSTTIRGITYLTDMGPVYQYIAHATAKVVNRSEDMLNKVFISHYPIIAIGACVGPARSMIVDNLNLAPGDTAKIPFPNLYLQSTPLFVGGSEVNMQVCIVAVSPNDHLDIFPDDNQWCEEVTFTVPIGIEEADAPQKLKVYPNPTTGIVFLPNANGSMPEVMDATGRRIALSQLTSDRIDLRGMGVSEGVYLLRLDSGDTGKVARVILTTP